MNKINTTGKHCVLSGLANGGWHNGVEYVIFVFQSTELIVGGAYDGQRKIFTLRTELNSVIADTMIKMAGHNKRSRVTDYSQFRKLIGVNYMLAVGMVREGARSYEKVMALDGSVMPYDLFHISPIVQEMPQWLMDKHPISDVMVAHGRVVA